MFSSISKYHFALYRPLSWWCEMLQRPHGEVRWTPWGDSQPGQGGAGLHESSSHNSAGCAVENLGIVSFWKFLFTIFGPWLITSSWPSEIKTKDKGGLEGVLLYHDPVLNHNKYFPHNTYMSINKIDKAYAKLTFLIMKIGWKEWREGRL